MKNWYIRNNDEHLGPYSLEELKVVGLYSDDYVWKEGLPQWTKANSLTELKELLIIVEHSLFAPETSVVTEGNYPSPRKKVFNFREVVSKLFFSQKKSTKLS